MLCWFWFIIDAGSGVEETEFNWDEYLEDTGALAAPHSSFKHVSKHLIRVICLCFIHPVSSPLYTAILSGSSFDFKRFRTLNAGDGGHLLF